MDQFFSMWNRNYISTSLAIQLIEFGIKYMNKIAPFLFFFSLFTHILNGQISPYSLSPKWYFGNQAGLDFTGGSPPVNLSYGAVNGWAQEGSSGICDPSKNIVFYTDSYRLYDSNNSFIQFLNGGTSSTQSSVSVPDPADPTNRFYLFVANVDDGGGGDKPASSAVLGISYYHIQKNAGSVTVLAGPVQIAYHNEVSEQICAGADGSGNYWIITHQGGNYSAWANNNFWVWPVTASGVGSKVVSSIGGTSGNQVWQGAIKINKCQTRLAAVYSTNPGVIEVYNWDQTTGKVTSLIKRINSGLPSLYGCEFSPDGNILYATTLGGNMLYQLDITSGTIYSDPLWTSSNNRTEIGTLQLGPDDKIYVVNASDLAIPCYIGVINNPDIAGSGCNYNNKGYVLNSGPSSYPNLHRGIANIAWLNPSNVVISVSDNCPSYLFSYSFVNYFGENIPVASGSEEWDFDAGAGYQSSLGSAPSNSYSKNGSFSVKLKLKDEVCNKSWATTANLSVNCVLPVNWVSIKAINNNDGVVIQWVTEKEINNNYFEVERSVDGKQFTAIGFVKDKNHDGINTYNYLDTSPCHNGCYYRIKQVDTDNAYTYSQVVSLTGSDDEFNIYPNPSSNAFTIAYYGNNKAKILVLNAMGQIVFQDFYYSNLTFGEDLPPGVYIVQVVTDKENIFKKIIKK